MEEENLNQQTQITKEGKQQKESKKASNEILGGLILVIALALFAFWIYRYYHFIVCKIIFWGVIFLTIICFMVAISSFFDWKAAIRIERLEEEAKQEEKDFEGITFDARAIRAEKQFKINQKELMRYYDMNLIQTKFLSGLGILLILFGLLIISASLGVYIFGESDKAVLIVGNFSGIIIDFVGAIFIKMYTQNIKAAVKFHAKLANSNNLLLANSIANKIESSELRENTLSDIAKSIVLSNRDLDA